DRGDLVGTDLDQEGYGADLELRGDYIHGRTEIRHLHLPKPERAERGHREAILMDGSAGGTGVLPLRGDGRRGGRQREYGREPTDVVHRAAAADRGDLVGTDLDQEGCADLELRGHHLHGGSGTCHLHLSGDEWAER